MTAKTDQASLTVTVYKNGYYKIGPVPNLPYEVVAQLDDYRFEKTSEFEFLAKKVPSIVINSVSHT